MGDAAHSPCRRSDRRVYAIEEIRCPTHLSIGQEAVAVDVRAALTLADYAIGTHCWHAHYLARGGSLDTMIPKLGQRPLVALGRLDASHGSSRRADRHDADGGRLLALVSEGVFAELKPAPVRACPADVYVATTAALADVFYPSTTSIVIAVRQQLGLPARTDAGLGFDPTRRRDVNVAFRGPF